MNVDTLILQRLPVTLVVIGSAQLLAILVAVPVGVLAAARPYSLFDQVANTLAFVGFSLPTFFTGLLLILLFSIQLDWLPFVFRADLAGHGLRLVVGELPADRSCRSRCSACSRAPRWCATCAPRCST